MVSSIYYNGDGSTRIFPVSFKILGDDYIRVYVDDVEVVDKTKYDIINNSVVFTTSETPAIGVDNVKIFVATSSSELGDLGAPLFDITSVANNLAEIIDVSESLSTIASVNDNEANINLVVANTSNINTVANGISNVNTVAEWVDGGFPIVETGNAFVVETVEELSSIPAGYKVAIVSDLSRGGTFIWSATGTANGGTVFEGVSGYWHRQYSGAVNVKWFGAKGDGITDDTTAINAAGALAATKGGGIVILPAGEYTVSRFKTVTDSGIQHLCIETFNNVEYRGSGISTTKITVRDSSNSHCFYGFNKTGASITNLTVDGNRDNQEIQNPSTGNDPAGIIFINNAVRIRIDNVRIINTPDYGIGFEGDMAAESCLLSNITVENSGADGIDAKSNGSSFNNFMKNIIIKNVSASIGQDPQQAGINPYQGWHIDGAYITGLSGNTVGIRFNDGEYLEDIREGAKYPCCSNVHIESSSSDATIGIHADSVGSNYSNIYIKGTKDGIAVRAREQAFVNVYIENVANDGMIFIDNTPSFLTLGERCTLSNVRVRSANDAGFVVKTNYNNFSNCVAISCNRGWYIENTSTGTTIIGGESTNHVLGSSYGIQDSGTQTVIRNVFGVKNESSVQSGQFSLSTTSVQTLLIPHTLSFIPAASECQISVIGLANDSAEIDYINIASTDATNVIVKIKVRTAIAGTGRIALRVQTKFTH